MNRLDIIIVAIIALSAIVAYYRGFLYTIFKTLSTVVSLFLSYRWYKPINSILRNTSLYGWLQKLAVSNVSGLQGAMGLNEQTQIINSLKLPIPNGVKENLVRHNNPEVYSLLEVDSFTQYIAGYIANFYLSIIAFVLLLLVIKSVMYIIGGGINFISRLPIISFFDRWLGFLLGIFRGFIRVSLLILILAILIASPEFSQLKVLLLQSSIGNWFYENNIILSVIDQLFL